MKKTLLFTTIFSMILYGTILTTEHIMTPYEEVVGVMSETYGTSSESCGVLGSNLDLPEYLPVGQLRGPSTPIIDKTPPRGPAEPIVIGNFPEYNNQGYYYRSYERPILSGTYNHWEYRPFQPVRNVVRFFHNRRPFRKAIGWAFGCR